MKAMLAIALLLSMFFVPPLGDAGVCVNGCSSLALGIGDFVTLGPANSGSCTACEAGSVFTYKIMMTADCAGEELSEGTFCTTSSTAGNQAYEVNSIGAGCSGTPQGCVRLCPCP